MIDASKLVNGGLYLVRWNHPGWEKINTIALFHTDRDECDEDETPREEWQFFGTEMTSPVEAYEPLTRLDVTNVDWDDPEAGAWPDA